MMNCSEAAEWMQRYIDRDLSEQEIQMLNAHLRECPSCAIAFNRLQMLHEQLMQLPKVEPTYSVVDLILPTLLELQMSPAIQREESAALDQAVARKGTSAAAGQPVRKNRLLDYVSWKLAGAVAVAACAVLFFIWNNGENAGQSRTASEAAPVKTVEPTAVAGTIAPIAPSAQNQMALSQAATPLPKDESNAGAGTSASANPTPVPDETNGEVKALVYSPDIAMDHQDQSGKTDVPNHTKHAPAPSPSAEPSASLAPAPSADPDASNGEAPEQTAQPSLGDKSGGGETGHGITALVPEDQTKIARPDNRLQHKTRVANGEFYAEVKDHKVTITSIATNAVVFTSLHQWTDQENIALIDWTPEGKFYYEVFGNGTYHAFLIDVHAGAETQLK